MKVYGLIGKRLSHSFSKGYFTEKFAKENLSNHEYRLFEIENIEGIREVFKTPGLQGLNVTIPYKKEVIPYLDELDDSAARIGAVNVISISEKMRGYNSDYFGFRKSVENWLGYKRPAALILGTGGASLAVKTALDDLKIEYISVSRNEGAGITYEELLKQPAIIKSHKLIINTTPLGMSPNVDDFPQIDYLKIGTEHFLYDLVYNPLETLFMKKGAERGAMTKNGLEMLHLQAEKSWEIWNGKI